MSNASQFVKDVASVIAVPATVGANLAFRGQRKQVSQATKDFGLMSEPTPDQAIPTPVTPMPIPGQDDLANIAAKRKSIEQQLFRRGRLSTILSNPVSEPLGG